MSTNASGSVRARDVDIGVDWVATRSKATGSLIIGQRTLPITEVTRTPSSFGGWIDKFSAKLPSGSAVRACLKRTHPGLHEHAVVKDGPVRSCAKRPWPPDPAVVRPLVPATANNLRQFERTRFRCEVTLEEASTRYAHEPAARAHHDQALERACANAPGDLEAECLASWRLIPGNFYQHHPDEWVAHARGPHAHAHGAADGPTEDAACARATSQAQRRAGRIAPRTNASAWSVIARRVMERRRPCRPTRIKRWPRRRSGYSPL